MKEEMDVSNNLYGLYGRNGTLNESLSLSLSPSSWSTAKSETEVPSAENPEQSKASTLKPEVGEYTNFSLLLLLSGSLRRSCLAASRKALFFFFFQIPSQKLSEVCRERRVWLKWPLNTDFKS